MANRKQKYILFIILPLILLICFWIWITRVDTEKEVIVLSDTPEWHLYGYDFDEIFVRAMGSTAEYVPDALLTPEEFEKADYIVGKPKGAAEYLTARFRLFVPDGRVYALTTDSVDFADRIYIGGQLYQEIGSPADNRAGMVPQTRAQYYTVMPENGVIEIVQQVSNFVHREGGNPTGFRIGSIETAGRHYDRKLNMSSIVMGACLLLFLVHMTLFLMHRSYKANLYFALFCLVWFFQTAVTGQRVLVALYPQLNWYATYRIECLAVPLAMLLLLLALDALFEGLLHRPVKIIAVCLFSAAAAVCLIADTLFISHATQYMGYMVALAASYLVVRLLMRFRTQWDVEAMTVFAGLVVFVYALVRDMLYHNNLLIFPMVHANFADFAVLVFILFQMVANFYGTMRQVEKAREREQFLAAENAALDRINVLKTDLMSTVSHELKTPLAVMMGYAQLVAKEMRLAGASEQSTADMDAIASEAGRMAGLVDELQGMSLRSLQRPLEGFVSLAPIIGQVARLYAPILERKHNSLLVEIEEALPPVRGSEAELTQVLFNLLSNADKHTEHGQVSICAALDKPAGEVTLCVSDTGTGMQPELILHVFQRGLSGDESGAGLGLAICKEIIGACDGSIHIDSKPGQGTMVTILLPIDVEAL